MSICIDHFRNVKRVAKFLPEETVKIAVLGNAISRLDTGYSLLTEKCKYITSPDSVTHGCKIHGNFISH